MGQQVVLQPDGRFAVWSDNRDPAGWRVVDATAGEIGSLFAADAAARGREDAGRITAAAGEGDATRIYGRPRTRSFEVLDELAAPGGKYADLHAQPEQAVGAAYGCKGLGFEHHGPDGLLLADGGRWECAACGDRGDLAEIMGRLAVLIPLISGLTWCLAARRLVILLPSDAEPALVGQFYGAGIRRVRGISGPLVAAEPAGFVPAVLKASRAGAGG